MTSICEHCGAPLTDPVAAILHYDTTGRHPSRCDRRRQIHQSRQIQNLPGLVRGGVEL